MKINQKLTSHEKWFSHKPKDYHYDETDQNGKLMTLDGSQALVFRLHNFQKLGLLGLVINSLVT